MEALGSNIEKSPPPSSFGFDEKKDAHELFQQYKEEFGDKAWIKSHRGGWDDGVGPIKKPKK